MSIAIYLIIGAFSVFFLDNWICRISSGYRESVAARVIVCFLFISVAFMPVLSLMLDEGPGKELLTGFSKVWIEVGFYFFILLAVLFVLGLIAKALGKAAEKRRESTGASLDSKKERGRIARNKAVALILLIAAISGALAIYIFKGDIGLDVSFIQSFEKVFFDQHLIIPV